MHCVWGLLCLQLVFIINSQFYSYIFWHLLKHSGSSRISCNEKILCEFFVHRSENMPCVFKYDFWTVTKYWRVPFEGNNQDHCFDTYICTNNKTNEKVCTYWLYFMKKINANLLFNPIYQQLQWLINQY